MCAPQLVKCSRSPSQPLTASEKKAAWRVSTRFRILGLCWQIAAQSHIGPSDH